MDEPVHRLLEHLAADVAPTGLRLQVGIFDLASGGWVVGATNEKPSGFGNEGYVMVLPNRQHLLPTGRDGGVDRLGVVDDVREWVIDELGHGWPELVDDAGAFIGLLEPVQGDDGRLVWVTGDYRVPLGQLAAAPVALPPRFGGAGA